MWRFTRFAGVAAMAVSAAACASQGRGANLSWNVSSGTWSTPGNWNSSGPPGAADNAFIVNGGTATISTGVSANCATLTMGNAAAGTVQLLGGSLTAGNGGETIGNTGIGSINQSGGTNSSAGNIYLATVNGSSGSYSLGGGLLSTQTVYVGYSGSGTFTQTGGTNSMAVDLVLGYNPSPAIGNYSLGGSGYLTAGTEALGDSGPGKFTQSAGTNTMSLMFMGLSASGTYSLSNGLLAAGTEYMGYLSAASFSQSGGNHTVSTELDLGYMVGGSGTYSLSGGSMTSLGNLYVANSGNGTFNQTGGAVTASQEFIGYYGAGSFSQSGGNHTISSELDIGYLGSSSGIYSLSGGSMTVLGNFNVGNSGNGTFNQTGGMLSASQENVGISGQGTITQSGGTNSVTAGLYIGYSGTAANSYTLSGSGLLSAPAEYVGGSGEFDQFGGTNTVTNLFVASRNGTNSLYGLIGGLLSAGTISLAAPGSTPSGFAQSGGTIGPGTMLDGAIFEYQGGVFNARLVITGTFVAYSQVLSGTQSLSFYAGQGIQNFSTFSVLSGAAVGTNGGGLANTVDNEGTIIMAGGTLAGGAAAGSGGPIVNNGQITGYGVLSSGVGIINNAQITPSGGILTISAGTSSMTNAGTIALASGYQVRISSGTLTNQGAINLNSSTLAGSGLLNNTTGNIIGPGTITAPFQNAGGVLLVPAGATTITGSFANSGVIQLSAASAVLSGGSIANANSILGYGLVGNGVNNTGTIESLGGPLTISGPVTNTGTIESGDSTLTLSGSLQNNAGGLIATDAGSKVLVSSGLAANLGTINMTGGVFDNNAHVLSNSGEIAGYGTIRTGGLTNYRTITLTGATSTVNGPVTNASGGSIGVSYNPAIFTGAVVNNGFVKSNLTTVTWAGGFTNNATYLSDPAANYFSSLANSSSGLLIGGNGDSFLVTGPLTNAGFIDLGGTSTMVVGNGAGTLTQSSGTLELGTGAALSAGTVEIDGGVLLADGPAAAITANLIYDSDSPSTYQGALVGAANSLTVNNLASVLVLSGSNTYGGGTVVEAGRLVVTSPVSIRDGTNLTVGAAAAFALMVPGNQDAASPVPEPGTPALLAAAALVLLYRLWRRGVV